MRFPGFGLILLASAALVSTTGGCVTRGVATSDETLVELRGVVESGPTPEPQIGPSAKKDVDTLDYHLHASGRVRCGGLIRKKQTVFVHAWATYPGPNGERVDVPQLELSFGYTQWLFAGAELAKSESQVEELSLHETIVGAGEFCSCVYAVAKATLLNTARLVTRETICPE